jgi:cation diffusion facilitator CzcD-associated flavoprotein CzcO
MSNGPARGDDCEVMVIGAGPYGLAAAVHLADHGVTTRVFGEPMSFWRRNMPQGMKLRSPWGATHIPDPHGNLSLDAFVAARGLSRQERLPIETFVDYGMWFQRAAVPDIDQRIIARLESAGDGFRAETKDGARIRARSVVVATGLARQAFRPAAFADIPAELASHASEHGDLGVFRGRRVAVIGRGQSACESAALLREAGAEVELICRGDVHWLGGSARRGHAAVDWLRKRLASPSGVGPFPLNWVAERPDIAHAMPSEVRARFNARCLRPGAAGWLRPRLDGVRIVAGEHVHGAVVAGERIALTLDRGMAVFDHALLGTGYQIDVARVGILDAGLLATIDRRDGAPVLGAGFESSVPGLHFVGASAVASYGPLMRFIAGAGFAARALTKRVLGRRSHVAASRRDATARPPARDPADATALEKVIP